MKPKMRTFIGPCRIFPTLWGDAGRENRFMFFPGGVLVSQAVDRVSGEDPVAGARSKGLGREMGGHRG